jgi:antitoxin component YwqK of YwqJK toxin-antitoxin module
MPANLFLVFLLTVIISGCSATTQEIKAQGEVQTAAVKTTPRPHSGRAYNVKLYFNTGELSSEFTQSSDGNKTGPFRRYHKNGKLYEEGSYVDDNALMYDGPFKRWFVSGQLSHEALYKLNVLAGPFKSWYENGILREEGAYEEGKLDGSVTVYCDNGKIRQKSNFKMGAKDGREEVNLLCTGALKEERMYRGRQARWGIEELFSKW